MSEDRARIADYWQTAISRIAPGEISLRGYPIAQLIAGASFPATIWLMVRGEWPSAGEARLLEAALVAAVDHGPHAPSIAIARMAVSTGLPLNGAIASAVNTLDDVHGGAGEQALELYDDILRRAAPGVAIAEAAEPAVADWRRDRGRHVPGFGHRFHPVDPRVAPLLALVDAAVRDGIVAGRHAAAAVAVAAILSRGRARPIPMNIDGITAAIYGELGFAPRLARGLFCLSRSVGILAHAWEQSERGERNKGPIPRDFAYRYTGPEDRDLG